MHSPGIPCCRWLKPVDATGLSRLGSDCAGDLIRYDAGDRNSIDQLR
jgi:hypothetical protein